VVNLRAESAGVVEYDAMKMKEQFRRSPNNQAKYSVISYLIAELRTQKNCTNAMMEPRYHLPSRTP
jgi:hypothetical protein